MSHPHYLIVPLDSRPVCYEQVWELGNIAGLNVLLPPQNLMGLMKYPAPLDIFKEWWSDVLSQHPESAVILSLDTLTYGGLIPSRLNTESLDELAQRSQQFLDLLRNTHRPRYGFSTIMRIPNYDSAEEEPDYWANYGKMLYEFSVETHRTGTMPDYMFNKIPGVVLKDFLSRREKNFEINQRYLDRVERKMIDFLVYCQDDTGPYGMNVGEAEYLRKEAQKRRLQPKVVIQTGADEVAMLLLAKALWSSELRSLKIYPWFFPEHGKKIMAKFDGIPLGNVVQRHIQTLGGVVCISPKEADLILMVNAPAKNMGDHVTQEMEIREQHQVEAFVDALNTWIPQKSVAVADVVFANGGDPTTMAHCFKANVPLNRLAAYAGWNTPGNSIGCALAMGAVVTWAQAHHCLNHDAHHRLLMKRLLDDWAYQAEARIRLRKRFQELPSESDLQQEMKPRVEELFALFARSDWSPEFYFPCQRLFEIGINL